MLKDKREGTGLEFKTFIGADGRRYLVLKQACALAVCASVALPITADTLSGLPEWAVA